MLQPIQFVIEPEDVQHDSALLGDAVTEVWAYQNPEREGGKEYLFVSETPEGKWKVCNVPFHFDGILAGAIVDVDSKRQITCLASNPDAHGRRILFNSCEAKDTFLKELSDLVEKSAVKEMKGCLAEVLDGDLMVIQVPRSGIRRLDAMIGKGIDDGLIEGYDNTMIGTTWPRSGIH